MGRQVGDLDVLAQDPSSGKIIGVSCKDWHGQAPGSEQFSHLVEMLEFENLKYGIFASSGSIANTLPLRAEHVRSTKGINIILLGHDDIAKLRNMAYSKQAAGIEDYFKTRLGLSSDKKITVADEIRAQKSTVTGRTVECERLLPINFWNEPPRYIENNHEILVTDSTLRLEPYMVMDYSLHIQARHPNTGKLLRESKDSGCVIVDAFRNTTLPEYDPVFRHLAKYYMNAEIHSSVQENGFAIIKTESIVNQRETLRAIRQQIAAQGEIRAHYTTAKNEQRQKIVRPRPEDVHVIGPYLIHVPIWDVRFNIGSRTFRRIYFGYDDDAILDEMSGCQISSCIHSTNAICTTCYHAACHSHSRPCSVCSNVLCELCAHMCIDCRKNFCGKHMPSVICVVCGSLLCHNCRSIQCTECKGPVCSGHRERCVQCGSYACKPHVVSRKFVLVAKNFCSQLCLEVFSEAYKSCGVLAKFKKIVEK